MNGEKQVNQWGRVVGNALENDAFKQRLLIEPAAVLTENGIAVPPEVELRVIENTDAFFT
jgi:hypothetical protein